MTILLEKCKEELEDLFQKIIKISFEEKIYKEVEFWSGGRHGKISNAMKPSDF